eukprot:6565462-Lingulodinium_polyedra.AAC.1
MATPPRGPPLSPSRAGEEATAVSKSTPEVHNASVLPVQCVSWSSTGFPAARAFSISGFLLRARSLRGSTSHLAFHEAIEIRSPWE